MQSVGNQLLQLKNETAYSRHSHRTIERIKQHTLDILTVIHIVHKTFHFSLPFSPNPVLIASITQATRNFHMLSPPLTLDKHFYLTIFLCVVALYLVQGTLHATSQFIGASLPFNHMLYILTNNLPHVHHLGFANYFF